MACVTSAILGFGLTVTVMVKVSVQMFGAVPKLAVTVYVTTILFEVALVKVWLMLVCAVDWFEAPVMPGGAATVQV
jgi:hypothetical protein